MSVSLALAEGTVLHSEADYRVALCYYSGSVTASFGFIAPWAGPILCSVQFGPVEACDVVLNRHADANVFAHGMESVRHLFPMLSAESRPVLLCVSGSGAEIVESERDMLLLPSRCKFSLVYAGMSDALVADLVLGLNSQGAFDGAMTWVLENGGNIGTLTLAASREKGFQCEHVFPLTSDKNFVTIR